MSNDLIRKDGNSISSTSPVPTFSAHAEGDGIAVGYADSFAPTVNLFLPDGSKTTSNLEYFNLIIGYDPFERDHILVDTQRSLTEYTSDDVKEQFCGWTAAAIAEIKKLPTIITQEWDRTDNQQAVLAFIRDLKVQDNGIKIRFQRYFPIPFSFLINYYSELAMNKYEIYRTHWTIKKVDLLEVMQDAGVFPGK